MDPHARAEQQAFHEDHVLADGTRIALRFLRPDDAEELRRGFTRLSSRSRYQRFLAGVPELTDAMLRYLTELDGENHVAIVATTESLDLKTEQGLGVARFVRLKDAPDVAEAAVTVADDAQGKGIGKILVRALGALALEKGIHSFRGVLLADNLGMRRLLDDLGARVHPEDGQTLVFDVPLQAPAESQEKDAFYPLRRLLRAAAESLGMISPAAVRAPEAHGEEG